MKPYKIIMPKRPVRARTKLIGKLKAPKIPLWFIKDVHTPPKAEIISENSDQGTCS